jgi:hypothetical protein
MDHSRQLQPIYVAAQSDFREQDADVRAVRQDPERCARVHGVKDLEARMLEELVSVEPQQRVLLDDKHHGLTVMVRCVGGHGF